MNNNDVNKNIPSIVLSDEMKALLHHNAIRRRNKKEEKTKEFKQYHHNKSNDELTCIEEEELKERERKYLYVEPYISQIKEKELKMDLDFQQLLLSVQVKPLNL